MLSEDIPMTFSILTLKNVIAFVAMDAQVFSLRAKV